MTERIEVFSRDTLIAVRDVDYSERKLKVRNFLEPEGFNLYLLPFGKDTDPSWEDYLDFLRERCFPPNRTGAKRILKYLGLAEYDPIAIVHKTHGVMNDDYIWLRFDKETLRFEDVKFRD